MALDRQFIGSSPAFLSAMEQVSRMAPLHKPVLVIGERGTGKELTAERLHFLSGQWENVLVKLNCAALPESLLETELFGHEAGAFTGATKRHIGRFELADGGTLFLDEIASMSLRLQEKLLRVIEYGEFERVGGDKTLQVDVRIVGAANMDLPAMVEQGRFRADLLDRLSFDVVTLPPLRYRREDIEELSRFFAMGMIREMNRSYFAGFSETAIQLLMDYQWPGNLRELKNVVERAVYRTPEDELVTQIDFDPFESPWRPLSNKKSELKNSETEGGSEDTQAGLDKSSETDAIEKPIKALSIPSDFKLHIKDYEQNLLQQALRKFQFNQKKTADELGLTYHQLRAYLRKYPQLIQT